MAWTERFVTATGGNNDGKDTVGFNLASATYTHIGTSITKTGAFAAYTHASGDYICISSAAEGKTDSLYLVASKTNNDTIVLGAYVAGGGAFTTDRSDVTSATGAWSITGGTDYAAAGVAAGNRVNVKAGTYTLGGDWTLSTAGTTTAPIWWRGYKTTIGDMDAAGGTRTKATDIPLIDADTDSDQIIISGAHQWFSNFWIDSVCTDTNGAVSATGGSITLLRCTIENTVANSAARALTIATNGTVKLLGCRFKSTTSANCVVVGASSVMRGCHILGGTIGILLSTSCSISKCIIESFGTTGISHSMGTSGLANVDDCSIYASATNGILITTVPTTGTCFVSNTIIGGCTYGIRNNTGGDTNGVVLLNNHFYNCTNNLVGITEISAVSDDLGAALFLIDDDTDPWVNKAANDFTLAATNTIDKSTSTSAKGYPGVFEGQTTMTSYGDIGAVQAAPSAGGGTPISFGFL